jgi:coniferyl-aldehyde dehydrogenase
VPFDKADEFVRSSERVIAKRFSCPGSNADYTHMINEAAWRRMQELVEDARNKGAQIVQPNGRHEAFPAESRVFPPTLILGASDSMRVMLEEVFGPILPVVRYVSLDDALSFINARPRPLALYYFDRNRSRIKQILEQTVSGGVTINDCIFHLPQHRLPFGGVGASGMGAYHGLDGFVTFSKKKGVLLQNALVGSFLARVLKPPYTPLSERIIGFLLGRSETKRRIQKVTFESRLADSHDQNKVQSKI